jgi:tetratricopeptide (TPR) repeat protein
LYVWNGGIVSRLLEIFGRGLETSAAELITDLLSALSGQAHVAEDILAEAGPAQVMQTQGEGPPVQGENIAENDFHETVKLIAEGQLQAAEEKLKFHLFENPGSVKGRMAAAALCLHRNNPAEAVQCLQSVYLRQPGNTVALYGLGHCYERLEQEAQAIEFYQDCLKFKRYFQLPRFRLAAIYLKNNQLQKAAEQYESVTAEYPDDIRSLVTLGYLCLATRNHTSAKEAFNNAILMHPDNFRSDDDYEEIGPFMPEKEIRRAIDELSGQLEQQADSADLHVQLADLLGMLDQDSEAVAHYEKALETQPNSLVASIKLGVHHHRAGRSQEAAAWLVAASELNDQVVEAYLGLAAAQHLAGDNPAAEGTLSLACSIQQNTIVLFCQAAALLQTTSLCASGTSDRPRDFDSLVRAITTSCCRYIASQKTNPRLYYQYGLLLQGRGNISAAIEAFAEALRINPTYHRARCQLVVSLTEAGNSQLALDHLTAAQAPSRESCELHYKAALLYCDQSQFTASVHKLQRLLHGTLSQCDTYAQMCVVLENLGLAKAAVGWRYLCEMTHHTASTEQ